MYLMRKFFPQGTQGSSTRIFFPQGYQCISYEDQYLKFTQRSGTIIDNSEGIGSFDHSACLGIKLSLGSLDPFSLKLLEFTLK